MRICDSKLLATALVLTSALATPALAQKQGLAPNAVVGTNARPFTISAPGSYVLDRSLDARYGGPAVRIRASDVTLDLAGHTLRGPGGRQGVGILIEGASNVRVFDGHLTQLGIGVQVVGGTNVAVTDLQIDGEDSGGAPPDVEIGILLVDTRGARIARNTITDTFLGIFVRGDGSGGNRIYENLLTGGDNGELAICYNPAPGQSGGGPHGDLVVDNVISRFRRGLSLSTDSSGNVVRDNTIAFFEIDIQEATPGTNIIEDNDEIQILP